MHITVKKRNFEDQEHQETKPVNKASLKMYINRKKVCSEKDEKPDVVDSQRKTKEDIPLQHTTSDKCVKCSNKANCVDIGYCLLRPSGSAKLTFILGNTENKQNTGKLSNSKGKNGYHENNMADHSDSDKCSDEIVRSATVNDHLHHDNVGEISSSHSPPEWKPRCSETSSTPKTNPYC